MHAPQIIAIHTAPAAAAPMQARHEVTARAGAGLAGDRYGEQAGTFSPDQDPDFEVTLIEEEALLALARDYGYAMSPAESRRNLTTRGVALNHLVGCEFWVGAVRLRGTRLCEPCDHLARLTDRRALKGLLHRGGLRAQIVLGGVMRVGDPVRPADTDASVAPGSVPE